MSKRIIAIIVALATAIAVCAAAFKLVDWQSLGQSRSADIPPVETTEEPEAVPTTTPEVPGFDTSWWHSYNLDLQDNDDPLDDFNFGPCMGDGVAAMYDADFRARMKVDPILAAACMAWLDANLGTRFLGTFYESCKNDWAATMNAVKERFIADQMEYYRNLDTFFAFLDKAAQIELRECKGVTDQMYMNPITVDGVPDIVVFETSDQTGYQLVYVFFIKGHKVEVAYRVNCGYQPTNVAKVMEITPQPNPVKPQATPKPAASTPKPQSKPQSTPKPVWTPAPVRPTPQPVQPTPQPVQPTPQPVQPTPQPVQPTPQPVWTPPPTPQPTPEPGYKDPARAPDTNTEPNDNPGPGPLTVNPADPWHSTEEQPSNSTNYQSYDDYRQDMQELQQVNQEQQIGGQPNVPTVTAPPNTTVDNNANDGTGYGGIDVPTVVQPPVHEAETGQTIDTTPGEAWGGPPD